jgi:hypothetical protein
MYEIFITGNSKKFVELSKFLGLCLSASHVLRINPTHEAGFRHLDKKLLLFFGVYTAKHVTLSTKLNNVSPRIAVRVVPPLEL